jgi:capsular polysaccharide export protein
VERRLAGLLSKKFFLVPLQTHLDAQVLVHSSFGSVPRFIEAVIASFARHALPDHHLVIKHHPMDRGYHDYSGLIRAFAEKHGIADRLLYVHDQHLPTLLANARGVVVINSTVGLSALHHATPTKVVGSALYDMPGLTAQCALNAFWAEAEQWVPDRELYHRFRAHLISATQINGSFYRRGFAELTSPSSPLPAPSARVSLAGLPSVHDESAVVSEPPLHLQPNGADGPLPYARQQVDVQA